MIRTTAWPSAAGAALALTLVFSGCTGGGSEGTEEPEGTAPPTAEATQDPDDLAAFPEHIAPEYPGSEVQYSSVEEAGDQLSFMLRAATEDDREAVWDFYRSHLEEIGFGVLQEHEEDGTHIIDFERGGGTELVFVSYAETDEGGLLTVSGNVNPEDEGDGAEEQEDGQGDDAGGENGGEAEGADAEGDEQE
ncbi:hypothetical protein [Sediminivirga luteola]|uniref:Uncharacterized protein n=1 Tax=Sediminivirga luteola TaxID=1774748 RepID=A0A8J2TZV3_9MICO|nr:hypothetical protein [Sediminivirga luteola]GGA21181.1 hypothetical protein GCM10011333_25380 [Sediminivirga luteola]